MENEVPDVEYALTLMGCWARDEKPGGPGGAADLAYKAIRHLQQELRLAVSARDYANDMLDRARQENGELRKRLGASLSLNVLTRVPDSARPVTGADDV